MLNVLNLFYVVTPAEAKRVDAEMTTTERLIGNALTLAFNAGKQIEQLLGTPMISVEPTLASDNMSVVVEFETLTMTVAPFREVMIVHIRDTMEKAEFEILNGALSRDDQDKILGMLERSRREVKTLAHNFSLKGVVVPAARR